MQYALSRQIHAVRNLADQLDVVREKAELGVGEALSAANAATQAVQNCHLRLDRFDKVHTPETASGRPSVIKSRPRCSEVSTGNSAMATSSATGSGCRGTGSVSGADSTCCVSECISSVDSPTTQPPCTTELDVVGAAHTESAQDMCSRLEDRMKQFEGDQMVIRMAFSSVKKEVEKHAATLSQLSSMVAELDTSQANVASVCSMDVSAAGEFNILKRCQKALVESFAEHEERQRQTDTAVSELCSGFEHLVERLRQMDAQQNTWHAQLHGMKSDVASHREQLASLAQDDLSPMRVDTGRRFGLVGPVAEEYRPEAESHRPEAPEPTEIVSRVSRLESRCEQMQASLEAYKNEFADEQAHLLSWAQSQLSLTYDKTSQLEERQTKMVATLDSTLERMVSVEGEDAKRHHGSKAEQAVLEELRLKYEGVLAQSVSSIAELRSLSEKQNAATQALLQQQDEQKEQHNAMEAKILSLMRHMKEQMQNGESSTSSRAREVINDHAIEANPPAPTEANRAKDINGSQNDLRRQHLIDLKRDLGQVASMNQGSTKLQQPTSTVVNPRTPSPLASPVLAQHSSPAKQMRKLSGDDSANPQGFPGATLLVAHSVQYQPCASPKSGAPSLRRSSR